MLVALDFQASHLWNGPGTPLCSEFLYSWTNMDYHVTIFGVCCILQYSCRAMFDGHRTLRWEKPWDIRVWHLWMFWGLHRNQGIRWMMIISWGGMRLLTKPVLICFFGPLQHIFFQNPGLVYLHSSFLFEWLLNPEIL